MQTLNYRVAQLSDTQRIIDFIRHNWDENHVYVKHPSLFRYDFIRDGKLTMAIIEINNNIEGIFGYFFYNHLEVPDIGGMLWKVTQKAQALRPLAGLELRKFVLGKTPHRFFGSPGAGLQTKKIYEVIGSEWIPMNHFVGTFCDSVIPDCIDLNLTYLKSRKQNFIVSKLTSLEKLVSLDPSIFKYQTPIKDISYLAWRYLMHPYHFYRLWKLQRHDAEVVIVSRTQRLETTKIIRIIDYLGPVGLAAESISYVFQLERENQELAYVDFVCSGFDVHEFEQQGFVNIDFNDKSVKVPTYFDPLDLNSVQIFANADKGFKNVVMVKGNGDQDRPNSEYNWCPN